MEERRLGKEGERKESGEEGRRRGKEEREKGRERGKMKDHTHTQKRSQSSFHQFCSPLLYPLTGVTVQFGHLEGICFTISSTEAEHNHWLQLPLHYHLDHLETAGAALVSPGSTALPTSFLQCGHGCLKVVLTKVPL